MFCSRVLALAAAWQRCVSAPFLFLLHSDDRSSERGREMDVPSTSRVMPPVPDSVIRQAEMLRINGNDYYRRNRILAAIDAYTEAIALNPDVAQCWTNRAQCFRRKNDWKRVEEDCRKAIELEPSSFKGHYMLGLAMVERKEYTQGCKQLEKALDLGKAINPEDDIIEEIWKTLSEAKALSWEEESDRRSSRLQDLREACRIALHEQYTHKCIPGQDDQVREEAANTYTKRLEYLSEVFTEIETANKQGEVPDYLCCKISLEIYRDPVITPSGITYERAMILDHLRKVGPFDPTTREPLDSEKLVPNLAIKEAVRAFLDKNGWAYKTMELQL